jgi:hypothetical protein
MNSITHSKPGFHTRQPPTCLACLDIQDMFFSGLLIVNRSNPNPYLCSLVSHWNELVAVKNTFQYNSTSYLAIKAILMAI